MTLVSAANAKALDAEASAEWGLHPFALVEAAGRACAETFARFYALSEKKGLSAIVLAGKGNNAADALVMLKSLMLDGYVQSDNCSVFCVSLPDASPSGDKTPLSEAITAAQKLGVPVTEWTAANAATIAAVLEKANVIIDGIAGTGLDGYLRGVALDMAEAVNALDRDKYFIVSIDVPSGNFDGWQNGMPIVAATASLAIEPQKLCLYTPAARLYSGAIIPVEGIFPQSLIGKYGEAELVTWAVAAKKIPPVSPTAYKYQRGVVEIRAGSSGSAGAARLAALGAQSAGAGLVRLIVDPSLYPVVAPGCCGIMVVPDSGDVGDKDGRFSPNAVLLGPGWGRGEDRMRLLESYCVLEKNGIPLILDADAVALAKGITFNGNAIITPHIGEFAAYTDVGKDEILNNPIPILRRFAAEKKVNILLKSHVLYAASPDGRIGIIDGMNPALGAGGSGDVLAGFCAAIAARWRADTLESGGCSCRRPWWRTICAAASLLMQAGKAKGIAGAFVDPAEVAAAASGLAGAAWLPVAIAEPQELP